MFGYLLWLAWPALLPLGSVSDLTHHLLLVDYIERHGQLPHDAGAIEYLGEMADYTPGLHLLSVIAGAIARTDGLHAALPDHCRRGRAESWIFLLILLRLLERSPVRLPLALAGVIAVTMTSIYRLGSFVDDSFLAQVVRELFALAAWWALYGGRRVLAAPRWDCSRWPASPSFSPGRSGSVRRRSRWRCCC